MLKYIDIRAIPFLLVNAAYIFMLDAANTQLAPHAFILLPAIFIVAPALYLSFGGMLFTVAVSALLAEAAYPVRTGLVCAVWILCGFIIHNVRFRFRSMDTLSVIAAMEAVNLFVIAFYAAIFPNDCGNFWYYAMRVGSDALASALVLAAVAKFTVRLPVDIMNFAGFDLSISDEKR